MLPEHCKVQTAWPWTETTRSVSQTPRNVLEVCPNAPTGAPAWTSFWYRESDMAVTDDPESTRNSTELSPIHPSRNQCPAPEICRTESSMWSAFTESGRSISEPVRAASTVTVSSQSDTVEPSGVWVMDATVGPTTFWSRNRTEFLIIESVLWLVSMITEFRVESRGDDGMEPWCIAFRPVWVRSRSKQSFPVEGCCSVAVDYLIACSSRLVWATSLSMSHLTAAEALDPQKVTTRPERCTIPLTGGERGSRRSRWLTYIIRPTSYQSHLIAHPPSQSKHLLQWWWHNRIWYGPLRSICHSEHVLRLVVLLSSKDLLRWSMNIRGRTEAGEISADLDQCLQLPVLLGSDDHPQVLLKFGIRLSPHKQFTN